MAKRIVGAHGVRVMRVQCDTCIFRPGNLMDLRPGRLKDMVEQVKAGDSVVICHKTLNDPLGAACRGSWDSLYTTMVQLAERLNFIVLVDLEDQ